MSREVDERKKRKALRKIRKAALLAEQGLGPPLSDWETQFLEEVEARLETYGSAFHDMEKGGKDEALSALQQKKLGEIDKKARGKASRGFSRSKSKAKTQKPARVRDISDDIADDVPEAAPDRGADAPMRLVSVQPSSTPPPAPTATPAPAKPGGPTPRPKLRVIKGGAEKT